MTEDQRRRAVLFNDITHAPLDGTHTWLPLTARQQLADHLWEQGWRRDVRPGDINDPAPETHTWARPVIPGTDPTVDPAAVELHLVYDDTGRALLHEAVLGQLLLDAGWERTA